MNKNSNNLMVKLLLCFILTLGISTFCNAQVLNIDRENETDTIFRKFKAFCAFSFSNEKQKRKLIDFTNTNEADYFFKNNYIFIFLSQVDLAFNGPIVNENNGFFQLRFRDNDKRKVSPDIFTQYQWNGIQGMEHRALAGINARFKWLEKSKSDLYTSVGVFYENEKWNPFLGSFAYKTDSLYIVYRNMLRLNLTAKFALKLGKSIDYLGSTFLQFPLNNNFTNPRWVFDSNLFFAINKYLSFKIHFDYNLDNFRPLPIDTYYYSLTTGIQIKI
jgi:hypothetical protein